MKTLKRFWGWLKSFFVTPTAPRTIYLRRKSKRRRLAVKKAQKAWKRRNRTRANVGPGRKRKRLKRRAKSRARQFSAGDH